MAPALKLSGLRRQSLFVPDPVGSCQSALWTGRVASRTGLWFVLAVGWAARLQKVVPGRILSRKRRPALGSCPARGPGAGTGGSARQGHAETIRWSHHPARPASQAGQGSDRGRMTDGPRCGGRAAGLGVPGLPTTPAHALGSEGPQCGPGKHRVEKRQCPPWAGRRGGAEMAGLLLAPGRASRGDRPGSGGCPAATAAPAGMA